MPQLFEQLTKEDGWTRFKETESDRSQDNTLDVLEEDANSIHFVFKGKTLCGEPIPVKTTRDNVPGENCQKCFERHRNLFNSDKVEDAYKDL